MTPASPPASLLLDFLTGGGETGALMRAHDWTASPLGAPQDWPMPLKTLVAVMLSARQPMFVAWGPQRIMLYNDGYAVLCRDRHPKALGAPFAEVWWDIMDAVGPILENAFAGIATQMDDIEFALMRDGRPQEAHFAFSYTPVRNDSGQIAGMFCACTETTGQVLADRRRKADTERQRHIFEQAPGFICTLRGPLHVFDYVNATHRRLFGSDQWVGKPVREAFPEIEGQGFFELLDQVYRTGVRHVAHAAPVRYRPPGGTVEQTRYVDFIYAPWQDENGQTTGIFCEGFDVTEKHLAQQELQRVAERQVFRLALEERLRKLADPLEIIAAAEEELGRHLGANRVGYGDVDATQRYFTTQQNWTDGSIPPHRGTHDLAAFGPAVLETMQRGGTLVIDNARTDARTNAPEMIAAFDALQFSAVVTATLVKDGRLRAAIYVHCREPRKWQPEDVALIEEVAERTWAAVERARVELALRESERELLLITDAIPVLISFVDAEQRYRFNNRIYELWFSHPREEIYGKTVREVLGDAAYDVVQPWIDKALAGQSVSFTQRVPYKDGGDRDVHVEYVPRLGAGGEVQGFYALIVDVTAAKRTEDALRELNETLEQRVAARTAELEQTQAALRQSQKLEAMGQLTGGVAHDFNNLLTPIIGGLDTLSRRGLGDAREMRLIDGALQSAERAKLLVQRLLAFARRQPLHINAVNVAELVAGMAELVASTTGPQIKVVVDTPKDLPAAKADSNQVEMAILNLSVNARDAMADGGTLRISASAETVAADHRAGLTPGRYIRVSVADTGIGMDEETRLRAVEPFFSTKGIGKGTGLGLSMVHGLVSQLGGALAISSQPRLGTNVEFWLPAFELRAAVAPAPSSNTAGGPQRGSVLLVDDEDLVRISTADMLVELGYAVSEATSAEQALTLMNEGLEPDLVVTDHLMPGLSGTDLARLLQTRRPGLPVLIVSGYAEVDGIASDLPRLTKPFRSAELAATLAGLTPRS